MLIGDPSRRFNACKTQYKCRNDTIPRHKSWYPDVTSMRVKHNINVELLPSLGIILGALEIALESQS